MQQQKYCGGKTYLKKNRLIYEWSSKNILSVQFNFQAKDIQALKEQNKLFRFNLILFLSFMSTKNVYI